MLPDKSNQCVVFAPVPSPTVPRTPLPVRVVWREFRLTWLPRIMILVSVLGAGWLWRSPVRIGSTTRMSAALLVKPSPLNGVPQIEALFAAGTPRAAFLAGHNHRAASALARAASVLFTNDPCRTLSHH